MIARDGAAVPTWGKGASAPLELRLNKDAQELEAHYERTVSNYIGEMTVLWVNISDDAGPSSSRAYIERNAIALLSNKLSPLDPSSNSWLGRYSPREGVRLSSLWNLNHINEKYDPLFLNEFANIVNSTIA